MALNGLLHELRTVARAKPSQRTMSGCSSLASRVKQPLKNTFVDRIYQRRKAAARAGRLADIGLAPNRTTAVEHHSGARLRRVLHVAMAGFSSSAGGRSGVHLRRLGRPALGHRVHWNGARWNRGRRYGARWNRVRGNRGRRNGGGWNGRRRNGRRRSRPAGAHRPGFRARFHRALVRAGDSPSGDEPARARVQSDGPGALWKRRRATGTAVARPFLDLFEFTGDGLSWRRKRGVPSMYAAYEFIEPALGRSASTRSRPGCRRLSNTCSRLGCATPCGRPASAGSPAREACS